VDLFVQYLNAPEQQRTRALKGSYLPTLETLYEDDEVLETVPMLVLGREAIQSARPRPASPSYPEMSLEMSEQFNALLRGASSPEQVRPPFKQSSRIWSSRAEKHGRR
jgi:multiple sugar transport system substrate-binding protein